MERAVTKTDTTHTAQGTTIDQTASTIETEPAILIKIEHSTGPATMGTTETGRATHATLGADPTKTTAAEMKATTTEPNDARPSHKANVNC